MTFTLPELPYKKSDLEPIISNETIDFHYGKHHQKYLDNLNTLILGSKYENMALEEIVKTSEPGLLFNNAAQTYNHNFYWSSLSAPKEDNLPSSELNKEINNTFGSYKIFNEQFSDMAMKHFGSGWVWLVKTTDNVLEIKSYHDAECPLRDGHIPLLVIDVWEHAYYIDYRNNRTEYINGFWKLVNWAFVESQLIGN